MSLTIRDRVIELRRVRAGDLLADPKNWRRHPKAQADALRGILTEVGYADALLARETPEGLRLIDGHLRRETTPDQVVPVLVLDLDEREAALLLASLDPMAAMAMADPKALDALLAEVSTQDVGLQAMLKKLAMDEGLVKFDAAAEWQGMPQFNQTDKNGIHQLTVHFETQEAIAAFALAIGQPVSDSTRFVWFPPVERVPLGEYVVHE